MAKAANTNTPPAQGNKPNPQPANVIPDPVKTPAKKPLSVNEMAFQILTDTKDELNELLADMKYGALRNALNAGITRLANKLGVRSPSASDSGSRKKFGPIEPRPLTEEETKSPAVLLGDELKREGDAIYPGFAERETDEILNSLTEMQIRWVAKHAGMDVTERKPVRITTAFIEEIKENIVKKAKNETLINSPAKATADRIVEVEEALRVVTEEKDGVEKALAVDQTPEKKQQLQEKLLALTEKEGDLYMQLDTLNSNGPDGSDNN